MCYGCFLAGVGGNHYLPLLGPPNDLQMTVPLFFFIIPAKGVGAGPQGDCWHKRLDLGKGKVISLSNIVVKHLGIAPDVGMMAPRQGVMKGSDCVLLVPTRNHWFISCTHGLHMGTT